MEETKVIKLLTEQQKGRILNKIGSGELGLDLYKRHSSIEVKFIIADEVSRASAINTLRQLIDESDYSRTLHEFIGKMKHDLVELEKQK